MKIWVIGDTHFNHLKLTEYTKRPKNFNEIIIHNWNKQVAPEDLVIHLGDVILGRDSELLTYMSQLKGIKVLCRGNHDHHNIPWYMQRGFSFICDYFIYKNIAFSHAPLTPLPFQANEYYPKSVDLNIHAHFHKEIHRGLGIPDKYYDFEYYAKNQEKYHLIQIEDTLRPTLLSNIIDVV